MINRRHFLIGFGATLGLAACASGEPLPGPMAQQGFAHLPPFRFRASRLDVRSAYRAPMQAPNAEHRMPTPPEKAMLDWANTRLQAVNPASTVTGEFVIEDAAVIETKLQKSEGFKAMFTYEPSERYDARAAVTLTLRDSRDGSGGSVRANAARSIEISENATLAQREQAWTKLVENLMTDLNTQMEQQVNTYLANWMETPGLR